MPAFRLRALIDVALAALACLACFFMGKDLNVDMLTYHLYSAHAFWTGTHAQTFMGAGSQSYINPLGYLPFYGMIRAGLPSLLIASVMAILSAGALMLLWRMGYRWLFAGRADALALSLAGAVLGGLSPLFLATLGTSFLDPLQAALFVLALYLSAEGLHKGSLRQIAMGGVALGLATGLKLSLVHLSAAMLLAMLVIPGNGVMRLRRFVAAGAGAAVGVTLSSGYWAWHLFREYGNPVFPFANSVFRSPDFPPVSLGLDRFAPESWIDLFTLPWRMVALKSGVYAEIAVPDLRFAALVVLLLVLGAVWLRKRGSWQSAGALPVVPIYLCTVMLLGYLAFVLTSGNGRYFLPLFLLVGPLLVWFATLVFSTPKQVLAGVLILIAAQLVHGGAAGYRRWDSTAWTSQWIDAEVPAALAGQPHRYLFAGSESDTFIAAFLHPDSRYLMIQGKNPLSPNREGAARVRAFVEDARDDLRVLVRESETRQSELYKKSIPDPVTLGLINDDLAAWNLGVSDQGCHYVGLTLGPADTQRTRSVNENVWPREYSLLSCPVVKGSRAAPEFHALQARLEKLSDVLSAACPQLFPAPPSFPSRIGDVWFFRYGGSDVVISSNGTAVALTRSPFGPFNLPIGTIDSLMEGRMSMACQRLPRR